MERFTSIQYLRAVAALMVVVKHAFHPPMEYAYGYGVDLFFVISGFVMVASTQRPTSASEFLSRRAWRILPMWWLSLILVGAIGLTNPSPGQWISSAFLLPYAVKGTVGAVAWGVGWTLCFEMLFYLIFAAGLWLRDSRLVPLVMLVLVAVGLSVGRSNVPAFNNLTHPLLLEFLMGVFIARLVFSGVKMPPKLAALGGLLFVLALALEIKGPQMRVLAAGIPMALILAGLVGLEKRLLDIPALHFLGDASYSIYLLHYVPIMLLAGTFGGPVLLAAGVGIGCLAYWLLERPILAYRKDLNRVHPHDLEREIRL